MPLVASNDPAAKDGKVRSHRFPAANTALPFVNRRSPCSSRRCRISCATGRSRSTSSASSRGAATRRPPSRAASAPAEPRTGEHVRRRRRVAQLRRGADRSCAAGRSARAARQGASVSVRRGESVRVEVVVRTRKVGHFFPGGTVDAFDVWVELEAVDDNGRVLLHSGVAADDGKGPVDPGAHFYRSLQLDEHGNPINKRNAWATRSVAYVRLIPPGAADTIHYRLQIPERRRRTRSTCGPRSTTASSPGGTRSGRLPASAIRSSRSPSRHARRTTTGSGCSRATRRRCPGTIKAIPDIPTTVMARGGSRRCACSPRRTRRCRTSKPLIDPSVRERWNDYGIGLLLQGDLRAPRRRS